MQVEAGGNETGASNGALKQSICEKPLSAIPQGVASKYEFAGRAPD